MVCREIACDGRADLGAASDCGVEVASDVVSDHLNGDNSVGKGYARGSGYAGDAHAGFNESQYCRPIACSVPDPGAKARGGAGEV